MDHCASTGEKMSEPEIDALMAGQEDENGSVHYEGKTGLQTIPLPFFFWISRKLNILTSSCSFRQAHHVCVRGQQRECWRNCSSPTDSPTVFVTSTLLKRPTTERQGLCTRDVEARPFFRFVYFVFFSISSLTVLSWDIAITSPL